MSEILCSPSMETLVKRLTDKPVSPEAHLNPTIRQDLEDEAKGIVEYFVQNEPQAVEEVDGWVTVSVPVHNSAMPFIHDMPSYGDSMPVIRIQEYIASKDDMFQGMDGAIQFSYAMETVYPAGESIDGSPEAPEKIYEEKARILDVAEEPYLAVALTNLDEKGTLITGNLDTVMGFDVLDDLRQARAAVLPPAELQQAA